MKYITKYKSLNYNSRNNAIIKIIIIHYTALENCHDAIKYLCNKENRVSSHYLISQNGEVYVLVNEKFRAWHAGQAYWHEFTDINSISIGIELDYNPFGHNNKFNKLMMDSLKKLIQKIQKKFNISKSNILAHSDVAPFRKKDPGPNFPWNSLMNSKITLNFKKVKKNEVIIIKKWFLKYNIRCKKKIIIISLSILGYDTENVYKNVKFYNLLIQAYKTKYFQYSDLKNENLFLDTLMKHLFKYLLTKE